MTVFNQWTIEQQRRVWLEVAIRALRFWKLSPRSLRWLGQGSNPVLKVAADDAVYALRLHPPGHYLRQKVALAAALAVVHPARY